MNTFNAEIEFYRYKLVVEFMNDYIPTDMGSEPICELKNYELHFDEEVVDTSSTFKYDMLVEFLLEKIEVEGCI